MQRNTYIKELMGFSGKKYYPVEPYLYLQIVPDSNFVFTGTSVLSSITPNRIIVNNKLVENSITLKANKTYDIYIETRQYSYGIYSRYKIPQYTTIFDQSKELNPDQYTSFVQSNSSTKLQYLYLNTNITFNVFTNKTSLISVIFTKQVKSIRDNAFKGCSNISYFNYLGTLYDWGYIEAYTNVSGGGSYLPNHYCSIKFNDSTVKQSITFDKDKSTNSIYLFSNISIDTVDTSALTKLYSFMFANSTIDNFYLKDNIIELQAYSLSCNILNAEFTINHIISCGQFVFKSITNLNIISQVNDLGCIAYLNGTGYGNLPGIVTNPIKVNNIICNKATIPSDIITITTGCFRKCAQLEEIVIQTGTTTVENYAFSDTHVNKIIYGDSVTTIGLGNISKYINFIDFGESVQSIGEGSIYLHEININYSPSIIILRSLTPPVVTTNTLRYLDSNTIIYVPDAAISDYTSDVEWGNRASQMQPLSNYNP